MSKKLILVFVCIVFFSSFRFAFANLSIDEIMYSPSSKQWVEVYNDTGSDIDLSQYKILDAGASKNGHSISPAVSGGSKIIPANSYGVIALDINSVNANYLFHSSLGIKPTTDSADTVILRDTTGTNPDNTVIVPYNSAVNGNSLQLINDSWIATTPTPGVLNVASSSTSSSDTAVASGPLLTGSSSNTTSSTSNSDTAIKNDTGGVAQIKTQIVVKTFGFAGIPISLSATAFGSNGEKLYFGKYFWNFGDGDAKEMSLADPEPFSHTYYYPGSYVVSLDYYQNNYSSDIAPDASSQVNIKIIPTDISISNVGDEKDFFVELTNNTDYNADISGWILASAQKSFSFPRDTIIPSKQKITISPKITNFSITDENTLKLLDTQNSLIFSYVEPIVGAVADTNDVKIPTEVALVDTSKHKISVKTSINDIPAVNNLTATVLASGMVKNNLTNDSKTIIIFIFAFIFIGVAAGIVYFVRRKKVAPPAGNDFEILDK
jgi:hypothetical protein